MELPNKCTSPAIMGGQQNAKRKFFQWAVKWFYANMAEDIIEKPDAPVLVCLLQSIGFQLREFEKTEEENTGGKTKPNNDTVRVFIECGTSSMRARLELNDVKCKCPNSEDTKDALFWSVSGTGPTATAKVECANTIEESGCNLLPPVSKETSKIIHDVTYHLLNIIGEKSADINQNCNNRWNMNLSNVHGTKEMSDHAQDEKFKNVSSSIVRSYTQPEILLSKAMRKKSNWTIRQFDKICGDKERDGTKWAADLEAELIDNDQPRPSPPKIASSPVFMNQLCSSLGQISLQSEEDGTNVTEHVIRARKYLDKALEILMAKKSPSSRNSSTTEQTTFLKPAPGGLNLTGGPRRMSNSSNNSLKSPTGTSRLRPNSSCSLPTRENLLSRVERTSNQAGAQKASGPILTRRSVGSALSTSTISQSANIGTVKRQITNIDQNSSISKIPGRRKSFGVFGSQPLKLAAATARNSAIGLKKKQSPEAKGTAIDQTAQKLINQPPGNLKFGYVKKKSSNV